MDGVVFESLATVEWGEFYDECHFYDLAAELFDEFCGGFHGAACGEEVVDEEYLVAVV